MNYNRLTELDCLTMLDGLFPFGMSMLRDFAKGQPDKFYIDDRVRIKNKKHIYAVVARLAAIREVL